MRAKTIIIATRCERILSMTFLLWLILSPPTSIGQTITVRGIVTAGAQPVQNALLTFVDLQDTNCKTRTFTDQTGNYQIALPMVAVELPGTVPSKFEVEQNYPNPFSSATAIPYTLPQKVEVQVVIYDLLGREVRKIPVGLQAVGRHYVTWDGSNNAGQKVAGGLYFYQLKAGREHIVRKMVYDATGAATLPLPTTTHPHPSRATADRSVALSAAYYRIRIENVATTNPFITPLQIAPIAIHGDTSINFTTSVKPVCRVYLDSLRQFIRGFGGANILQWRPDMTADQVRKAFGTGEGEIGLSILRLRVPHDLNNYTISMQIPTARLAQSYGAIVFASPWTPPPSLKTNNNIVGGELKETAYAAYAQHLKTFADSMAAKGAPLYAISIQNEPDITVTYESCDWNPAQMTKFIAEYGHTIGTKIIAPESFQFLRPISDAILNDSTACAHLDIVGGHIYGEGIAPYPLAETKGKEIWMTEHLDTDTSWNAVLGTGKEIHDCLNVGMNAYVWWYLVRYYGPILENGAVSKRGYVMAQFARFVRPGFRRLLCTALPQRNIYISAFKNDTGKIVIVAINLSSSAIEQAFAIPNCNAAGFNLYTTTKTKNCLPSGSIPLQEGVFTIQLEASSINTLVSY